MTEYTVQGHRFMWDEEACDYCSCWDTIGTDDLREAIHHAEHTCGPVHIYINKADVFRGTPAEAAAFLRKVGA